MFLNRLLGFKQHGLLAFLVLTATCGAPSFVVNTRVARSTMEGGWLALLRERYGDRLVHNALVDTPLAALGRQWGFGLYVVRAALDPQLSAQDHAFLFG